MCIYLNKRKKDYFEIVFLAIDTWDVLLEVSFLNVSIT